MYSMFSELSTVVSLCVLCVSLCGGLSGEVRDKAGIMGWDILNKVLLDCDQRNHWITQIRTDGLG